MSVHLQVDGVIGRGSDRESVRLACRAPLELAELLQGVVNERRRSLAVRGLDLAHVLHLQKQKSAGAVRIAYFRCDFTWEANEMKR